MRFGLWGAGTVMAVLLAGCGGGGSGGSADTKAPVFTSDAAAEVAENTTAVLMVTTDDADAVLSLSGTDAALFALGGNTLSFKTAPDYEQPHDSDTDNVYELTVTATDNAGNAAHQALSVTVTDIDEGAPDTTPPVFTSTSTATVAENTTAVLIVTTDDADAVLSLGGTDAAFFVLSGNALSFKTAPNYEHPLDNGADNVYELTVTATDASANTAEQHISVTVTDVADYSALQTNVLKTGQAVSYYAHDDGNYTMGVDRSYTRNADDTVTDTVTGLMWQDDAAVAIELRSWITQENNDTADYNNTSGVTAATYCEALELGGYADWRLPSRAELVSLSDYGRVSPAIDPVFEHSATSGYWSATTFDSSQENAWYVQAEGNQYYDSKTDMKSVRCVRAGW
jgi:hypothetical protein